MTDCRIRIYELALIMQGTDQCKTLLVIDCTWVSLFTVSYGTSDKDLKSILVPPK
jgi:hypothetical protein